MPNLGGIFDLECRESVIRSRNKRQVQSLEIPGIAYRLHEFATDGFAVALLENGIFENGPQPAGSGTSRFRLLLDGEIYNAAELAREYGLGPTDGELSDPLLCLRLFEQQGPGAFRLLNGLFAIVVFDTESRELWLSTDRMGFRPIFYRQIGDTLLFGSEMKAIVSLDPDRSVDKLGVLELLTFGQPINQRTWLTGYQRVPPGVFLHFRDGSLNLERFWQYSYDESASTLDQESYFTGYRSLMDRAVERCMKGSKRIGIFLSGGYYSRAVAAAIRQYHLPIPAFTFGEADSRDVRYATELATALGFRHKVLSANEPQLLEICQPIVWRTEGMLPFIENTSIQFHAEFQQEVDIILVGLLGEFGGSHTWPALLATRSRESVIRAVFLRLTKGRQHLVQRYLRQSFIEEFRPELLASFNDSFESIDNDHPLNIADSWRFHNYQFRGSYHAPSTDRHRFEIRAPHLDTELVEFLLTIPPSSRIEQRVYKKMLAYGFPRIRSVPCTNSGKPINPNFALEYVLMTLRLVGRKVAHSTIGRLGANSGLGRESSDLGRDLDAETVPVQSILKTMLDDGVFPTDVFDADAIRTAAESGGPADRDHALFVSLLISWGFAAKYFLYSQATDVPSGFELCGQAGD